jgi:D-alanyl-D-alanine carboxypeptidase
VISDPLLAPSRRRAERDDGPPPRPPFGRRRIVVVLGAVGVAAALAAGATLATGDDDGGATGPDAPSVATAAPTTVAPATTVPSIDAPGSLWWLVNRDRPLPEGYVPPDLVTPNVPLKPDTGASQVTAATGAAFEAMVADAAGAGFQLQLNSGYRSYEQQQMLYDRFVEDYGIDVATLRVALPGTSEHQTGLAADVGLVGLPDDQLFGDTEASVWVTANAHRFGFIIRYPPDKAHITGYDNEPWHLRYVGVELATELQASGLTMEEHFGLAPATATAAPAPPPG